MEVRALMGAIFLVPLGPCKGVYAASYDVCLCKYRNVKPKEKKIPPIVQASSPKQQILINPMMRRQGQWPASLKWAEWLESRRHSRVTAREL